MSELISTYRRILLESAVRQQSGDEAGEDRLLSELDALWMTMSRAERECADSLAREVGQAEDLASVASKWIIHTTIEISLSTNKPRIDDFALESDSVAEFPSRENKISEWQRMSMQGAVIHEGQHFVRCAYA